LAGQDARQAPTGVASLFGHFSLATQRKVTRAPGGARNCFETRECTRQHSATAIPDESARREIPRRADSSGIAVAECCLVHSRVSKQFRAPPGARVTFLCVAR